MMYEQVYAFVEKETYLTCSCGAVLGGELCVISVGLWCLHKLCTQLSLTEKALSQAYDIA